MRPLIAVLIVCLLLGGIYAYARFADSVRPPPPEFNMIRATGEFTVRVTRTFDSYANKEFDFKALEIFFKKQVVYSHDSSLPASEIITIPPLVDVEEGENEIVVHANAKPALSFDSFDQDLSKIDDTPLVMRVEILRNGNVVASESIWNEPGIETVQGSVGFTVSKSDLDVEHDH